MISCAHQNLIYLRSLRMLRLFIILVSMFAFSKVAFAADADMNKNLQAVETTTDNDDMMDDTMTDKVEEKKAN